MPISSTTPTGLVSDNRGLGRQEPARRTDTVPIHPQCVAATGRPRHCGIHASFDLDSDLARLDPASRFQIELLEFLRRGAELA
jgi:hypothetical protein